MYKRRRGQMNALEAPIFFSGVKLDPSNEWVKMVELISWETLEEAYAESFGESTTGNPAKPVRMAVGTLIIKERYRMSDEDVVKEIRMNPYLQYFIGLPGFTHEAPFDASAITRFRKRVTPDMLAEANDRIIGRERKKQDKTAPPQEPPPSDGDGAPGGEKTSEKKAGTQAEADTNEGTLILDATCAPQDIRYPTDISLLNEAREKLEKIIDTLHEGAAEKGKKPRTYRRCARRDYLRYARNRKPKRKQLRKALRQQLGYVSRDLTHIDRMIEQHPDALSKRQAEHLETIRTLYKQQKEMYDKATHSVADRIVSISQPYVRPIVRGKPAKPVEFGAKIEVSLVNGYARIEKLSWDAFNESGTLQESVERFKAATGKYPARILADKIFRTRDNLAYCKGHNIRMNGPKLGRPPKDPAVHREQLQMERKESGERSEIEGAFGVGKRRYTLRCVMTRLQHTSEVSIHVSLLTMNLFRKLRFLFCFFCQLLSAKFYGHFSFASCSFSPLWCRSSIICS